MNRAAVPASAFLLILAVACGSPASLAQWPTRPIRIIVPFGAGTSSDLAARLFAPLLSERWRQPVVVDNRPGGDGVAGAQAFVAARDNHTLLFAPSGLVTTNPLLHHDLPYDPVRDLVPIASAGRPSIGIAAGVSLRISALSELVSLIRASPNQYVWAGTPGLPELVFKAFLKLERLEMRHVGYRDIAGAVHDLRSGRVHVMIAAVPTLSPALQSKAALLLAVTSATGAAVPVSTATEAGYPILTVDGLFGFWGWREMPSELRERIAADVRAAAADADLISRLARVGFTVEAGTPAQFVDAVTRQRGQVANIARILGIEGPRDGGGH